jgi:hypothetical protein
MPVALGHPRPWCWSLATTVTLLSPDMEFGGSADIVIASEDSGLAYTLIAESDVFGYVWCAQLDRALSRAGQPDRRCGLSSTPG